MTIEGANYISHITQNENDEGISINAVKLLDPVEYEQIILDSLVVNQCRASQDVFRAVISNRDDVVDSIVNLIDLYVKRENNVEAVISYAIFDISRRFANMCSLFRSFLDHFDRYFVYTYGKDSQERLDWRIAQSNEYDKYLSYKIIYLMRNYIQHYDMPPLSISVSESAAEEGISFSVEIDIELLKEDKEIKRKFSKSTDIAPNKIALMTLIDDWDKSFNRISNFANISRFKNALPAAQRLIQIRQELQVGPSGSLATIWLPKFEKKPENISLTLKYIPELLASKIIENS